MNHAFQGRRTVVYVYLLIATAMESCTLVTEAQTAEVYRPYRFNLTSTVVYKNPYLEVNLTASFTSKNGTAVSSLSTKLSRHLCVMAIKRCK